MPKIEFLVDISEEPMEEYEIYEPIFKRLVIETDEISSVFESDIDECIMVGLRNGFCYRIKYSYDDFKNRFVSNNWTDLLC